MDPGCIIIYAKDIQRITNRSERFARNLHKQIKKQLGKEGHQLLTLREFCTHQGLDARDVCKAYF
jgi:DNA-binding transcriptional regulator YhcF (GntR family)